MTQYGLHHYHKNKKNRKKSTTTVGKLGDLVSSGAYIFGICGIFLVVPQLWNVWVDKNVSGLSIITWIGFTGGALYWVLYGITHKDRSITIVNSTFLILYCFITAGILMFQK